MALKDDFDEEACFTTKPGAPTLTIEEGEKQVMVPWINFHHAIWQGERIELHFQDWRVDVLGNDLEDLWNEVQRQRVLTICKSKETQSSGCFVRYLAVTAIDKKQEIEEENESPQFPLL